MPSQEEKATSTIPCEECDNRGELWRVPKRDLRGGLRKMEGEKTTLRNGENMPCLRVMPLSLQGKDFFY